MTQVFVYGTLKKEHSNHSLLEKSKYIGKCTTDPLYTLIDLGPFPAVLDQGRGSIVGEVYKVSEATLGDLDMLEGYPHLYQRHEITTHYGKAWVYTMDEDQVGRLDESMVIESGEWRIDE